MTRLAKLMVAYTLMTAAALALCAGVNAQCRVDMSPPLAVEVTWTYVSQNSIAVGVSTTQAAKTWVEFGGKKTAATDAHFQHLHLLTGLETGKAVTYRVVAEGADGKRATTADATLTPTAIEGAVRIPEDMQGPPYVIDKPGTYLVTKDVVCDGMGVEIKAANVTLDLNGHTLTYDEKPLPRPEGAWNVFRNQAPMGVVVRSSKGPVRILNGRIAQGAANSAGVTPGVGYNPVFVSGAATEIGGIEAVWSGDDVAGLFLHGGEGHEVHHCVTEDKGSGIKNRHQAICNIGYGGTGRAHHNLIKRSRHRGINALTEVDHNEVYVDSQATNAFGIDAPNKYPFSIHHNRIYGRGEHPIGIGATGNVQHGKVFANYVEVENTKGSTEYGNTGSACYRMTWGSEADDIEVYDNVFIVHARKNAFVYKGKPEESHGRAVWIGLPKGKRDESTFTKPRTILHHNTIIATNAGDGAKAGGICVVCLNESPNLVFEDNRVESNWANVLLGDGYGHAGGYAKFIRNTFVKVGNVEGYATVRDGYRDGLATAEFVDNRYEGGASLDCIQWSVTRTGDKVKEIRVSHALALTVRDARGPVAGAAVAIADKDGKAVFEGKTDAAGKLTALVAAERIDPDGRVTLTPHKVTATADGKTVEQTVTVDASKQETLTVK